MRLVLSILGLIMLMVPNFVLAAFNVDATRPGNSVFANENVLVSRLFDFGITIAGIIFVILFLVGGVQYLTGAGNEDQTGKAKRLLVDSVVGLILVLGSWAIATYILKGLTGGFPSNPVTTQPSGGESSTSPPTGSPSGGIPDPSTSPSPITTTIVLLPQVTLTQPENEHTTGSVIVYDDRGTIIGQNVIDENHSAGSIRLQNIDPTKTYRIVAQFGSQRSVGTISGPSLTSGLISLQLR